MEACRAVTCDIPYPHTYVIFKLRGNDVIDLDGRLEDKAWKDVAWSDAFIGGLTFQYFSLWRVCFIAQLPTCPCEQVELHALYICHKQSNMMF